MNQSLAATLDEKRFASENVFVSDGLANHDAPNFARDAKNNRFLFYCCSFSNSIRIPFIDLFIYLILFCDLFIFVIFRDERG